MSASIKNLEGCGTQGVVCLDQPEETTMTYQSDPNTNRRSDRRDDIRYTGWIIGGIVVLAIVIAAFVFTSTGRPW
jgi:hypothetical protein